MEKEPVRFLILLGGCTLWLLLSYNASAQVVDLFMEAEEPTDTKTHVAPPVKEEDFFDPARQGFSGGLFFGHILFVDPEKKYVFIKPSDRHYPRKLFYLDRRTKVYLTGEGKRRKATVEELREGSKTALRYFSRDTLAVADDIYLVSGDFEPRLYQKQLAVKKKTEGEAGGEKKKAEAAGGHKAGGDKKHGQTDTDDEL